MSDMTKVKKCLMGDCVFNQDDNCHALAINIGDATEPHCDTYIRGSKKAGDPNNIAGVGACKCDSCEYNEDFQCLAGGITVGKKGEDVDCLSYEAKAEILVE
jgi:hypothetical protein